MFLKKEKTNKTEKSKIGKESQSKKNSKTKLATKLDKKQIKAQDVLRRDNELSKKQKKKESSEEKSSLQSVIEALLSKQLEEKTLDFQIKSMGLDPAFAMGAYTIDPESPLSYSSLFSYLGGKAKENPYLNYFERKRQEREEKEKKDMEAKELSYEKITKFVESGRIQQLTNVESYEATPFLKEKYELFKIFNQAYSFLLYQMIR